MLQLPCGQALEDEEALLNKLPLLPRASEFGNLCSQVYERMTMFLQLVIQNFSRLINKRLGDGQEFEITMGLLTFNEKNHNNNFYLSMKL